MSTMIGRGPIGSSSPPKVTGPLPPSCACADPDVERLRDLIAAGTDQITASRLIWPATDNDLGPAPFDPGPWGWLVRSRLSAAFPWLRLPTASEVS